MHISNDLKILDNRTRQSSRVDWIKVDDENPNKRKVLYDKLGEYIYQKYKNVWLMLTNEDKSEFWEYLPLTHNYSGDKSRQDIAKTQVVWQLSDIERVRTKVHQELKKHGLWSAKASKDTLAYIKEELACNSKTKAATVGRVKSNKILFADGMLEFDLNGTTHVFENSSERPHQFAKYYFTDFCDYSIKDAAKADNINAWFAETFKDSARTLKQFIGYSYFTTYEPIQAYLIIKAGGGDGKSTTIKFIENMFPLSEVSHVSLQALTQSEKNSKNFSLAELQGKRLNARDDITKDFIQDVSQLKTLTGGGSISASRKFKNETQFSNYAKLLFACNSLPSFRDSSRGWGRRAYIITAHNIPNFNTKYDMQDLLNERGAFAIECIKEFCDWMKQEQTKNKEFAELYRSQDTQNEVDDWKRENDPIQLFIDETLVPKTKKDVNGQEFEVVATDEKISINDMFRAYTAWTEQTKTGGGMGKIKFNREFESHGFTKKKARTGHAVEWCWEQVRFNDDILKNYLGVFL